MSVSQKEKELTIENARLKMQLIELQGQVLNFQYKQLGEDLEAANGLEVEAEAVEGELLPKGE